MKKRLAMVFLAPLVGLAASLIYTAYLLALPVRVEAGVNKRAVFVGDNIKYRLDIITRQDTEIEHPAVETYLADFYIKDKNVSESASGGKKIYRARYILACYSAGEHVIPSFEISYRPKDAVQWQGISAPEIRINVKSVLEPDIDKSRRVIIGGASPAGGTIRGTDDAAGRTVEIDSRAFYKIREAPPARDVKSAKELIVFASVAAIALIAGFALIKLIMRFWRRKPPPPPPDETALEKLKRLNAKGLYEKEALKEFYFELSSIVKEYVKQKFLLGAAEMTSGEFLGALTAIKGLSDDRKKDISEFMRFSDDVKFTGYAPESGKSDFNVEFVRHLIRGIEEKRP